MARVAASVLASALIRSVQAAGGNAALLARGDPMAGAILILAYEKGANPRFVERGMGPEGASALVPAGPDTFADEAAVAAYWAKRRSRDPDLWVIELDIPSAERFAAETLL